jgi:hypothetical protein
MKVIKYSKKRHIRRRKKYNRSMKLHGGAAIPPAKNNRVDAPLSGNEMDAAQERTDLQFIPPMLPHINPIHPPAVYLVNEPNINELNDNASTENDNVSVYSNNSLSTLEYGGKKYINRHKDKHRRTKYKRSIKRQR